MELNCCVVDHILALVNNSENFEFWVPLFRRQNWVPFLVPFFRILRSTCDCGWRGREGTAPTLNGDLKYFEWGPNFEWNGDPRQQKWGPEKRIGDKLTETRFFIYIRKMLLQISAQHSFSNRGGVQMPFGVILKIRPNLRLQCPLKIQDIWKKAWNDMMLLSPMSCDLFPPEGVMIPWQGSHIWPWQPLVQETEMVDGWSLCQLCRKDFP